ncbi:hypothetical protein ACFFRE_09265 [Aciditerrimonas ferrireducens]|uniref:Uncharacterized protein n=1 Tax=Aciditerrimonas ferrireducens TaxID=667306 RepID=A0ABV6C3R8_9ACTN|nr:hypothetical protein [Aciditerrimonas ferrireducens]MCK4177367.1 hypothetical protein [Aciditerrimonas ferrireducens]
MSATGPSGPPGVLGWVGLLPAQAVGTGGWWDGPRLGQVLAYDSARGLGELGFQVTEQTVVVPFHCTALADGGREVAAGTPVVCELRPGHRGRLEAVGVRVLGPPAAAGS